MVFVFSKPKPNYLSLLISFFPICFVFVSMLNHLGLGNLIHFLLFSRTFLFTSLLVSLKRFHCIIFSVTI